MSTSCSVTAIAAATLLHRQTQAAAMEGSVFKLQSGVNPKKIQIAEPRAIECGVSAIVTKVMWWSASHFFFLLRKAGNRGPSRRSATDSVSATGRDPTLKQSRCLRHWCGHLLA